MPNPSSYRTVLATPGGAAFSASGFLARLPISMMTLGIVLLISAETGSYGLAGVTSAVFVVAASIAGVLQGRLIDRVGQRRVMLPAVLVWSASMSLLVVVVEAGQRAPLPQVFAAIGGASIPTVGSAVRARWTYVLGRGPEGAARLQTAFAIEAVVDEAVFMTGPPLATFLASSVTPSAGIVAAVAVGLVGMLCLTSLRRTEPPVLAQRTDDGSTVAMPWLRLAPVVLVSLALGGLFGSTEVTTVAFAQDLGHEAASGPLLATWALGSLLAGVISGTITWRAAPATRMRWGLAALTLLMAPTPLIGNLVAMDVLLFLAGFAIAPTLIASVSFIEQTVPAARLTEGITLSSTAMAAGLAPGAAIAGVVIDHAGASAAYLVPVVSGLLGVLAAFASRPRRSVGSEHDVDQLVRAGGLPPDA